VKKALRACLHEVGRHSGTAVGVKVAQRGAEAGDCNAIQDGLCIASLQCLTHKMRGHSIEHTNT
jgi:hypothetical protein